MEYSQDSADVFFSVQPFWNMQLNDVQMWQDTCLNFQCQISLMHADIPVMDCVPGVGLIGILFSRDVNHPMASCYGVLKDHRTLVPLNEIKDGIFFRLSPGAFTRLFRIPSNEIPAQGVFLEHLLPTHGIIEKMAAAVTWEERRQLFKNLLGEQQNQIRMKKEWETEIVRHVLALINKSGGAIRMKDIEKELFYSARYIQEITQRQIGLSPKQLCDQVRFQNILSIMRQRQSLDFASLSQQFRFYDQSHFIQAFKDFSGISPGCFMKEYQIGKISMPSYVGDNHRRA